MPTYQYRCQACHNDLEAFQKFTDDPLTICPDCGGSLRKVFNAVGIVFKGSGFYQTDYRSDSYKKAAAADKKPGSDSKSESKSDSGSGKSSDSSASKSSGDKPKGKKKD